MAVLPRLSGVGGEGKGRWPAGGGSSDPVEEYIVYGDVCGSFSIHAIVRW